MSTGVGITFQQKLPLMLRIHDVLDIFGAYGGCETHP